MNDTPDPETVDPDANLLGVRMKAEAHLKAEAHCQAHMGELMTHARDAVARIKAALAPFEPARPIPPEVAFVVQEYERRAAVYRQHFVTFAVRGAVLSGRIPETAEAEAWERCADDAGLMAFLNEMARVPVGFVDRPVLH